MGLSDKLPALSYYRVSRRQDNFINDNGHGQNKANNYKISNGILLSVMECF